MAGTSQVSYSTNLGLSLQPEFDAQKYPDIFVDSMRVRMGIQLLQSALDSYTGKLPLSSQLQGVANVSTSVQVGNLTRVYPVAGVNLTYGQLVYLYNVGGVLTAGLASASVSSTCARGFVSTTLGITAGQVGEIQLLSVLSGLAGLTPGTTYYLSNTAGFISSTAGTVSQKVGYALSTTDLFFNPTII